MYTYVRVYFALVLTPTHTLNTSPSHQRFSQGLIPGCFFRKDLPNYSRYIFSKL